MLHQQRMGFQVAVVPQLGQWTVWNSCSQRKAPLESLHIFFPLSLQPSSKKGSRSSSFPRVRSQLKSINAVCNRDAAWQYFLRSSPFCPAPLQGQRAKKHRSLLPAGAEHGIRCLGYSRCHGMLSALFNKSLTSGDGLVCFKRPFLDL